MNALRLSTVAAAALLGACGLGAPSYPSFEETAYRIEGLAANPDGAGTIPTAIYRDGAKMRVETELGERGQATIVFDRATNAAYVLSAAPPAAEPAPATPVADPAAPAAATPAVAPSAAVPAATPAVASAGVAIRVGDSDAPQPMEAPWAALGAKGARSVGECEVAGESGHQWRPRQSDHVIERTACISEDGIVLRVAEGDRVIFEATRLERGPQDPRLFVVPSNYQMIDAEAVVDRVGETMQQMDSVTGEPPATPAAAAPQPKG